MATMPSVPKRLSDAQRQKLCEMMHMAFCEIRMLGWKKHAEQAADLADAFHNIPFYMWRDDCDLRTFRNVDILPYSKTYPGGLDYIKIIDEIISMGVARSAL